MKKNILTKLLALMMALVLILGVTCEALAEFSFSQYTAVVQKKASELYSALLKTTETGSFIDLIRTMSASHMTEINALLTSDEATDLDSYFAEMALAEYEEKNKELEIFEYVPVFPAKNYAHVAPFGDPVVGDAPAVMLLAATPLAEGDTDTTNSANGIELEKDITPTDNGYEITLKAFATGTTVTTETSEAVPTDIILVLDQSGSMSNKMTTAASVSYNLYGTETNENLWQNQNNIFVKVGDEYKRVTVTREEKDSTYTYIRVNNSTNSTNWLYNEELYLNRANLFEKDSNGEYYAITVEEAGSYIKKYTYKLPVTNVSVTSEYSYGRPDFRNREVYLKTTVSNYKYTYQYTDDNGNMVTIGTSEGNDGTTFADGTLMGSQLYRQQVTEAGTTTRMAALKTAVTSFLNSVNTRAVADNVNHRVAIVGFASTGGQFRNTELLSTDNVINYGNAINTNYLDALVSASVNGAVNTRLTTAVSRLDTGGDTYSEYGMDMANKIFAQYPLQTGEKRNRVVVMFTDGYTAPSGSNDIDYSMSDRAISNANTTKNTYGATVYTVGIFDNADPTANITDDFEYGSKDDDKQLVAANRYMHYVSSNYPSATSLQNGGNRANTKGSYYLSANDGGTLSNIFQTIAGQIESGSASTTLDEEAVLKDIIATSFDLSLPKLENGDYDPSGITVQVADCTGKSAEGVYSFATPVAATGITVTADQDKAIDITGFDYAENWCGVVNSTARGKQLIIKIPIKVREGFLGGNNVPTNGENSGIYENATAATALKKFERKSTDIAIADVVITAQDKNVYLLDSLTAEQLESGSTMKSGNVVINTDPTVANYGLETWQNAYVNITLPDYTGQAMNSLEGDTTYTLTGSIAPKTTGGTATVKSDTSDTANVYVFKPVLTFADSTENYLSAPANAADYYNLTNYKEVVWKHGDTVAAEMTGDEPKLTLTYLPTLSTWITDGKVTSTTDIEVNVNVTIVTNNVTSDVTAHCTSIRNPDGCAECSVKEVTGMTKELSPEFIVHIKNVYGELKIIKKGLRTGESAVFTVKGKVADGTAAGADRTWTVVLTAPADGVEATATITGLLVGSEYTVTEDPNWTWTYIEGDEPNKSSNTILALNAEGAPATVTITNTESDKWLHDESSVKNVFNKVNPNN